jgi:RPA family protein
MRFKIDDVVKLNAEKAQGTPNAVYINRLFIVVGIVNEHAGQGSETRYRISDPSIDLTVDAAEIDPYLTDAQVERLNEFIKEP